MLMPFIFAGYDVFDEAAMHASETSTYAPADVAALPDGMSTVSEATHGAEHVLIAAQHPNGAFEGAAVATKLIAALNLQPTNVRTGPMTIGSGFQSAWSENFEYAESSQTRAAELATAQLRYAGRIECRS